MTDRSSLDTRREGSLNAGEGDKVGFGASDRERVLLDFGVSPPSWCSSCWVKVEVERVNAPWGARIIVADILQFGGVGITKEP